MIALGGIPNKTKGRVGMWRGGVGPGLSVADPFGCRCLTSLAVLRFHTPLIEPDVRVSRIRLSDKASRGRPREGSRLRTQLDQAQLAIQVLVREA